jgi:hypothetical protein
VCCFKRDQHQSAPNVRAPGASSDQDADRLVNLRGGIRLGLTIDHRISHLSRGFSDRLRVKLDFPTVFARASSWMSVSGT